MRVTNVFSLSKRVRKLVSWFRFRFLAGDRCETFAMVGADGRFAFQNPLLDRQVVQSAARSLQWPAAWRSVREPAVRTRYRAR